MKKTNNFLNLIILSIIGLTNLLLITCSGESTVTFDNDVEEPTVTTTSAIAITSSEATLTGSVNPHGSQTNIWFEYGTSSSLNDYVGTISRNSPQNFEYDLSDLEAGSTYYFRIAAANTGGTVRGTILSFVTLFDSITGVWSLSTRDDFSNEAFKATLNVNLNLTQSDELLEGYSEDVYRITGTFNDLEWIIQRNSNNILYPFQGISGSIVNGGININSTEKLLEFDLISSDFIHLRGVAPGYESMWGDITLKLDMTELYGTDDGIITLTGMWDAERE